jgi:hypothetical protein
MNTRHSAFKTRVWRILLVAALLAASTVFAASQDAAFQLDPAQSAVKFTLEIGRAHV